MIKKLIKGILLVIFALLALIVFLPTVISVAFNTVVVIICIGGLSLIAWLCKR